MKRIIIICEGQTELEFCQKILAPYFIGLGIIIQPTLIKKSGGGLVHWEGLKNQINKHLHENAYVSLFVDYYGIQEKHGFPLWLDGKRIPSIYERLTYLEDGMFQEINSRFFIPNIQLHEFETLLFSSYDSIVETIPSKDLNTFSLDQIFIEYDNPELINDGLLTAPSKRLESCISGYVKTLHGPYIAENIGLETIRIRCQRFDEWLKKLERI